MSEVLKGVGLFIGVIFGLLVVIYAAIFFGYLFGMLLAILPWIGGALTGGTPISKEDLPVICAWLAVIALFIRSNVRVSAGE